MNDWKVGSLYLTKEHLTFGHGSKINGQDKDVLIPPESCLLFLFEETISADINAKWINFLYNNKIIFRAESEYDFEWFKEVETPC